MFTIAIQAGLTALSADFSLRINHEQSVQQRLVALPMQRRLLTGMRHMGAKVFAVARVCT